MEEKVFEMANHVIREADSKGVDWIELRFENTTFEYISYINGRVRDSNLNNYVGVGIRVLINDTLGFSSISGFNMERVLAGLEDAIKIAKTSKTKVKISSENIRRKTYKLRNYKTHPKDLDYKEKIELIKTVYEASLDTKKARENAYIKKGDPEIKMASVRYGSFYGDITILTDEGLEVSSYTMLSGIAATMTLEDGKLRGDGRAYIGTSRGLDKLLDVEKLRKIGYDASKYAYEKTYAEYAPAGYNVVITAPSVTGVFAHESFGHMSEGDFALTKTTTLADKLGEKIGSEYVNIYDGGVVPYEEGYYYPVDSEGIETQIVSLVEKGVFKRFLHNRETAGEMKDKSTGNGRAQNYSEPPIVRMRNTYLGPGDWSYEELIKETKEGIFVDDDRGGEANLDGTFTFTASRGYYIKNGEIQRPLRDIVLTGQILDLLKYVDAATKEIEIISVPFGGCGKGGQMVYVGLGGPYLRIEKLLIGGR